MPQTSNDGRATAPPPASLVGHWQLTAGNRAECTVTNFGFRKVRASMPIVEAVAQVDVDGTLRAVHALLQLSEIDTGNSRRDKDLAKPGLLDTARFPSITFSAGGVGEPLLVRDDNSLSGTLTTHGSTIPVDVHYSVHESVRGRLTVSVRATFHRQELGIKAPALMIGRRVQVEFDAEFELLA